jgi:hypothetical protein
MRSLASADAGSTHSAPVAIVGVMTAASRPGYLVFRQVGNDRWQLVGEVDRKPGQTAKQARAQAIQDATHGKAKPGGVYRALLRSEWKIASE